MSTPNRPPVPTDAVAGLDALIDRMRDAESIDDWSFILGDHLTFGNKKLSTTIGIFNLGSATDCPNLDTDHCQVPKEDCYALRTEQQYPHPLAYRRRQGYLWDSLDPETFADAFLRVADRRHTPTDALRFNQAGDFRTNGDVVRAEAIAERLAAEGIDTYLYTASDYLDWSLAEHMTVNASNPDVDGDQRYVAVPTAEEIPDEGFHCPHDVDTSVQCGDCQACIHPHGDGDIYITMH